MLNTTKKIVYRLAFGANVATILLLWFCASSVYIKPSISSIVGVIGLSFPILLFANLCFLILWTIFRWRTVWLPLVGFLCCIGSVRTYIPINIPSPHPKGCIKILSYNVMGFGTFSEENAEHGDAALYIKESQADIVCIQEGNGFNDDWFAKSKNEFNGYHVDTAGNTSSFMILLSRFPIIKKENIEYESDTNASAAFWIKIENDTVIVINNHLESNKLTGFDRQMYKNLVKDPEAMPVKQSFKFLASKVGQAGKRRACQADSVAAYIERHKGHPMIVCGDFNDSPISYAHHTISKNLIDTYVATGNGMGHSFNRDGIYVRIDNILCTDDWQPYGATVDNKIKASDHYPIFCYLQRKKANK